MGRKCGLASWITRLRRYSLDVGIPQTIAMVSRAFSRRRFGRLLILPGRCVRFFILSPFVGRVPALVLCGQFQYALTGGQKRNKNPTSDIYWPSAQSISWNHSMDCPPDSTCRSFPPFCCESAPAFRRGEESQFSFSILRVMWYY